MKRLLLPLLLAGTVIAAAAAPARRPNVLFILADDLGWGDLGCYGNTFLRTPNLDRLATEGIVFSQAYAGHPKCECSRASLQMGRTTTSLNAVDKRARNWNAAPADSLANTLKRAQPAYRAAHFGKWQWPTPPSAFGSTMRGLTTMTIGMAARKGA